MLREQLQLLGTRAIRQFSSLDAGQSYPEGSDEHLELIRLAFLVENVIFFVLILAFQLPRFHRK